MPACPGGRLPTLLSVKAMADYLQKRCFIDPWGYKGLSKFYLEAECKSYDREKAGEPWDETLRQGRRLHREENP